MKQKQHTPGPWKLGSTDRMMASTYIVTQKTRERLASVIVEVDGQPDPEGAANARLIVNAPVMFDALEQAVVAVGDYLCGGCEDLEALRKAHKVLLKALQQSCALWDVLNTYTKGEKP